MRLNFEIWRSGGILCYNFSMNNYCVEWLLKELPVLIEKNVISGETAEKISQYYEEQKKLSEDERKLQQARLKQEEKLRLAKRLPVILTVLASLLIAGGIISLIAYNWAAISRLAKSITAVSMLMITQGIAVFLKFRRKNLSLRAREGFSLFWALLFGGIVAFVSQIYKFPSDTASFLFVWALSSVLITYVFKSSAVFILAQIQIFAYMIAAWDSSLLGIYVLVLALFPFVLTKDYLKWQRYNLITFASVLFIPMIFRCGGYPLCFAHLCSVFAAIFLILFFKGNENFKSAASVLLLLLSLLFLTMFADSSFFTETDFEETGNFAEHLVTYIISAVLLLYSAGLPLYRNFIKKEKTGINLSLILIPLLFLFTGLFYARNTGSILSKSLPASVFALSVTAFSVLYAFRKKTFHFAVFLVFAACCLIQRCVHNGIPMILVSVYALFVLSLILFRGKHFELAEKQPFLILARIFAAILLISFYISLHESNRTIQGEKLKAMLLDNLVFCIPLIVFSIFSIIMLFKKEVSKLLCHADIFLNLIFVIIFEYLWLLTSIKKEFFIYACSILILANGIYAAVSYLVFNRKNYLAYLPLVFVQGLILTFYDSNGSEFLWILVAVLFFIHLFGRNEELPKVAKFCSVFSAIGNGIIFLLEAAVNMVSERYAFHFSRIFIFMVYLSFVVILCAVLCYRLIKKREIFNFAMLLHISLFFTNESFGILAVPATALFCFYYFYRAYKESSVKKANITAVYLTATLMIRFFTLGYGLVAQGVTLILLGVALLAINRFIKPADAQGIENEN